MKRGACQVPLPSGEGRGEGGHWCISFAFWAEDFLEVSNIDKLWCFGGF